ncbi:hypothetical protein C8Q72DRAFT_96702 [Fomitopsis betulina]|nr:hypothetical protein C8Q72DRAFT_96702 [Fomitopsis betulina]
MRYAAITLALATVAAAVPSFARPVQAREDSGLYAREFDNELVARVAFDELLARGDPHLLNVYWKPRPKGKRADVFELFARGDFDEELLARGDPHLLNVYWKPRPKGKREASDDLLLSERNDFADELLARGDPHLLNVHWKPRPKGKRQDIYDELFARADLG